MNTYLAVITTVLVITQIIRLIQNSINLHRQKEEIQRSIEWFNERDVSKEDFDTQRECVYLLREWLKKQDS